MSENKNKENKERENDENEKKENEHDKHKHDPKKSDHGHKRKPHEKHIVGRAHFNNLDLSKFAKHDWKAEHEKHLKSLEEAKKKAEEKAKKEGKAEEEPPEEMTVRVYFQTLDRTGDEEGELLPANDPVFDEDPPEAEPIAVDGNLNYVDIVLDGTTGFSAKDLVDQLEVQYGTIFSNITYKEINTIPPPYYVENITIGTTPEVPYPTTPDDEGYNPDPPRDEEIAIWDGNAWMFFDPHTDDPEKERWEWNDGSNTLVPYWDPDDNDPWDENDPNYHDPDGEDDYPNETLDEYELWKYLTFNEDLGRYEIIFSFETQCFDFIYKQKNVNGEMKWVMAIRSMRRKKKDEEEKEKE
jgi:hypothetical protein